jgi:hypothetical protein
LKLRNPLKSEIASVTIWEQGPPRQSASFLLPGGSVHIYHRAEDIDPAIWGAAFGDSHKDFEYYRLIEETMTADFAYRYLVLFDREQNPVALQPLILVDQDLAASARATIAHIIAFIRSWQPRFLRGLMLMAGCLVGDAALGLIAPADAQDVVTLLAAALLMYARSQRISLVTVKDTPAASRDELSPLLRTGYTRLPGFPPLTLDLNFASFEEYMATRLSKVTRKGLRRKLRKSGRVTPPLTLEVFEDCTKIIDEIYPLYLNVAHRSPVSFEVFTRDYFLEAGRRMPGRFRYFIWRQSGKAVAFSFCTIWKDTIYDNDIGLDYDVAYTLNLYYVSFRDVINWALRHSLKYYRSAPFNYDAKLHLRLQPLPVDLYVRHVSPLVNAIIKLAAPLFAPTKLDPILRNHFRSTPTIPNCLGRTNCHAAFE